MLIKPDGSILMGKEGSDGSIEMYDAHGNLQLKIDPSRNPFSDQSKGRIRLTEGATRLRLRLYTLDCVRQ